MKSSEKDLMYSRNYGFWSKEEQKRLSESKVAIAGVGGDGFQLGLKLAQIGVERFSIADPEIFEIENSNRVIGATSSNIGRNKADVFYEMVKDMRPDAEIEIFHEGVNAKNVSDFMEGSNLVIDESELTKPEIGATIAREARKMEIPDLIVMNIGFAAIATSLKGGCNDKSFEQMMGFSNDMSLDEISKQGVEYNRCLPYIPRYGDFDTFLAIKDGKRPLPSISQGVDVASSIGTTEAFLHLTSDIKNHRQKPVWAPKFKYIDSYTNESGIIRFPRASYYMGMIAVIARCKLGINPKADY